MNTQQNTVIQLVKHIGDAIKEAGKIPSGHLFAILSQFGCTMPIYEQLIAAFKDAGKVKEENHLLIWID